MHGYFPALNSWPSLLGDMLADAINCVGFTWVNNKLFAKTVEAALIISSCSYMSAFSCLKNA